MRIRTIAATAAAAAVVTAAIAIVPAASSAAPAAAAAASCTGQWQLVPTSQSPPGTLAQPGGVASTWHSLGSVTALSAHDVIVTGEASPAGADTSPSILRWNGQAITPATQIPTPAWDTGYDATAGLSSFDSDSDGWVFPNPEGIDPLVGFPAGDPETAQRWHDGRWTTTPLAPYLTPIPEGVFPYVRAVVSLSPDNAWAVGFVSNSFEYGSIFAPLIEHWDGAQWSIVPSPAVANGYGGLQGLAVISPTDIWAVGAQDLNLPIVTGTPLLEHWDGSKWSIVPAPAGAGFSGLNAVSADGTDDVWAVGDQGLNSQGGNPAETPLVEHWDGTSWSVQQLPDTGNRALTSVYAAGPGDVWAGSGFAMDNAHEAQTGSLSSIGADTADVFVHFDGQSWTTVPVPGPHVNGLSYNYASLAGTGSGDIWAAGTVIDSGNGDIEPVLAHFSCG